MLRLTESNNRYSKLIKYVNDLLRSGETKFDKKFDHIHFWCDSDADTTVFFQSSDGGYAALNKDEFMNMSDDDLEESLQYQLEHTAD